ncbi:MAG TPA: hypothetical protein VMZ11_04275 [Mycobacteriales bacterium]|nr:hypothetical protein [Mycobacteriales bacterium]
MAHGSRVVDVDFRKQWSIGSGVSSVVLGTTGTWAAVVIEGASRGTRAYRYGRVRAAAPLGCTARDAQGSRVCPYGGLLFSFEQPQRQTARSAADPLGRFVYPAGRYRVYVLTGQNARASLTLHLPELPGRVVLTARKAATAGWTSRQAEGPWLASTSGSFPVSLRHAGGAVLTVWSAARPNEVLDNGSLQACIERAGAVALSEAVADNGCDLGAGGDTVGAVGGAGGGTSSQYDVGSWVTTRLEAGSYLVRFANHVVGDHPATGCTALWYETAA